MYTVVALLYISDLIIGVDSLVVPVFEDLGESEIWALMGRPYKTLRETIAQRNKCSCEHVKPTS